MCVPLKPIPKEYTLRCSRFCWLGRRWPTKLLDTFFFFFFCVPSHARFSVRWVRRSLQSAAVSQPIPKASCGPPLDWAMSGVSSHRRWGRIAGCGWGLEDPCRMDRQAFCWLPSLLLLIRLTSHSRWAPLRLGARHCHRLVFHGTSTIPPYVSLHGHVG